MRQVPGGEIIKKNILCSHIGQNSKKLLKGKLVTLKIKGKTYKVKTNKKGKAVFKVKNLNKKGTFVGTIKFAGDKYFKGTSKKVNVVVN